MNLLAMYSNATVCPPPHGAETVKSPFRYLSVMVPHKAEHKTPTESQYIDRRRNKGLRGSDTTNSRCVGIPVASDIHEVTRARDYEIENENGERYGYLCETHGV